MPCSMCSSPSHPPGSERAFRHQSNPRSLILVFDRLDQIVGRLSGIGPPLREPVGSALRRLHVRLTEPRVGDVLELEIAEPDRLPLLRLRSVEVLREFVD